MEKIRVRFAPSPTGYLHLGSARTALFNWLYARHAGGKFVLRIEDTDKERSKKEFLDEILEDLKWMGMDWDEGPFFQSQRLGLYQKAADKILKSGLAYKEGDAVIYKVEKGKVIEMNDLVHGQILFNTDEIKDQVLIKSDGSAAYNFACVVDDADMGITHIIRGDDHISNTPKQIMFYEALGFKKPQFAHMSLMMGKDGSKLSKRHGGISVTEYKEEGFLPQALANYLLLLGWSPKADRELITLKQAVAEFDIKDISDVQVRFDMEKLRWMNGEYIMAKTTEELLPLIKKQLVLKGVDLAGIDDGYLAQIIRLYKVRMKTLNEFVALTDYFFKDDFVMDIKAKEKYLTKQENRDNLKLFYKRLETLGDFTKESIEKTCRDIAGEKNIKPAGIIHASRTAVSGKMQGAGLFEIMEVLGKKRVMERIRKAVEL